MRRFLLIMRSNWISWSGAIVTTLSCMAFLTTWVYMSLHASAHGPYLGLFAFLILPVFFLGGILAIPVGLLIYRKNLKQRIELVTQKPLHLVRLIGLLTLINFAVVGTGGYEAVHYMDSQEFCGTLCHEVMSPTYDAYVDSAHAKVACVQCHIGSGASWFVKAKISGMRQVLAVLFDTYQRPIPTPVHNLRPARDTCEQCHWPDKFTGDRLVVRKHYKEDEAVTETTTVLVMKTGGVRPDGKPTGIHWHVHPGNEVTYASDEKRTKIHWVRFKNADGKERVFTTEEYSAEAKKNGVDTKKPPTGELRTMDCLDCHNQPSHQFQDPEQALDKAIFSGLVSRKLPSIRKHALEALKMVWTKDGAKDGIQEHLEGIYAQNPAVTGEVRALIPSTSEALAAIWRRNIHPSMNITWGSYPLYQGHQGCFRCHDGQHMDDQGEAISADCSTCHTTLADKVTDPAILKQLGLDGR